MNKQYTPRVSDSVTAIEAASDSAPLVPAIPVLDSKPHPSGVSYEPLPRQSEHSQAMPQITNTVVDPGDLHIKIKRRRRRKPPPPPEVAAAKRRAFLQRNREAASKCRIKKKHQIGDMETHQEIGRMELQMSLAWAEDPDASHDDRDNTIDLFDQATEMDPTCLDIFEAPRDRAQSMHQPKPRYEVTANTR